MQSIYIIGRKYIMLHIVLIPLAINNDIYIYKLKFTYKIHKSHSIYSISVKMAMVNETHDMDESEENL